LSDLEREKGDRDKRKEETKDKATKTADRDNLKKVSQLEDDLREEK
jgi:hypothetical protein